MHSEITLVYLFWYYVYIIKNTIPCENIRSSVFLQDDNLDNTYVPGDSRTSCQFDPPFIIKKHIHPSVICNPKYQCYLNSVIQKLLPILRTISHNFQFNSSTEGSLLNVYWRRHMVHPILRMWMPWNFDLYNMIFSTMVKFKTMVRNVLRS